MIFTITKNESGVMLAAARAFAESGRKQKFIITAERGGERLEIIPEAEWFTERGGERFKGFAGIDRYYWRTVPGYAEQVATKLLEIMNEN